MAKKALRYANVEDMMVEAEELYTKASDLYDKMDYEAAAVYVEKAVELYAPVEGFHHMKLNAQHLLAVCWERDGKLEEAEAVYQTLHDMNMVEHGPDSVETIRSLLAIVSMLSCSLQRERAQDLLVRYLDEHEDALSAQRKGRLLHELSYVESDLTLHEQAFQTVHKAIAVLSEAPGSRLVAAYDLLASLHQERGQIHEALDAAKKGLEIAEELGLNSTTAKQRMASVQVDLGQYEQALPVYEDALITLSLRQGMDSVRVLRCRSSLAEIYCALNRLDDAEQQAREVMDVSLTAHKEDAEEVDCALFGMVAFLAAVSRYKEALELAERNNTHCVAAFGRGSEDAASALRNLACVRACCGMFEEAQENFEESLSVCVAEAGEGHHLVAEAYRQMGKNLLRCGRVGEAHDACAKASAITTAMHSPTHVDVLESDCARANALVELGRTEEALELATATLQELLLEYSEEFSEVTSARLALARAQISAGIPADGLETVSKAEETLKKVYDAYSQAHIAGGTLELIRCHIIASVALLELNRVEEALERLEAAEEMAGRVFREVTDGNVHWLQPTIGWLRGEALLKKGDAAAAVAALQRAVAAFEEVFGEDSTHPHCGAATVALGKAQRLVGDDSSEDTLVRGIDLLSSGLGDSHWRTVAARLLTRRQQ